MSDHAPNALTDALPDGGALESGPVTVAVTRMIQRGKVDEAQAWARGVAQVAAQFPGHMGIQAVPPADPQHPELLLLFRFDTLARLRAWELSDARREWLARAEAFTVGAPAVRVFTGLEYWFAPPPGMSATAPPSRLKMTLLTWVAITPLTLVVSAALRMLYSEPPPADGVGYLLRTMAMTAVMVTLMSLLVMPALTRLFARWLFPKASMRAM